MTVKAEHLLSWKELKPLVGGISRMTLWRMERKGQFPKAIPVSPGRVAWRESDVAAWQAGRAA